MNDYPELATLPKQFQKVVNSTHNKFFDDILKVSAQVVAGIKILGGFPRAIYEINAGIPKITGIIIMRDGAV